MIDGIPLALEASGRPQRILASTSYEAMLAAWVALKQLESALIIRFVPGGGAVSRDWQRSTCQVAASPSDR